MNTQTIRLLFITTMALLFTPLSHAQKSDNEDNCNTTTHRMFKHQLLIGDPVCLPKKIKRVVVLEIGAAEFSVLTGKKIVGAPGWLLSEMSVFQPSWKAKNPNVQDVGSPANLEKIITLKPDVILAVAPSEYTHKLINIPKAKKIAPVITASAVVYDDWKTNIDFWSQALNEKATYHAMLKNYNNRIAELRKNLQEKWNIKDGDILHALKNKKVSIASVTSHGTYMWLRKTSPSKVIEDIGFSRTKAQAISEQEAIKRYKNDAYAKLNKEHLNLLDGDLLFGFAYASHNPKTMKKERKIWDKMLKSKLFQRLDVAKNNKAYYMSGAWFRSNTYLLANQVLDDVSTRLTGKPLEHTIELPSNTR